MNSRGPHGLDALQAAVTQPDESSYYSYSTAELAAVLHQLDRDPARAVLLRGATVITMDDTIGDLPRGDVLVSGRQIVAVGADLSEPAAGVDALVIKAGDTIVLPGLVDAHRHCWQGQLRRLLPDANIASYWAAVTKFGIAEQYRPQDVYAGNTITLLGALDAGITTVLDFSHNSTTAAHADAVFASYSEAGIRAVHAASPPIAGDWQCRWPDELVRLRTEFCAGDDALASVRLGVNRWRRHPVTELLAMARHDGFAVTFDAMSGPAASEEIESLAAAGYLGSDITFIHCNDLTDAAWDAIVSSGVNVTLAPLSDEQIGIADGVPPIEKCRSLGIRPGLSVDVEISLPGDLFSQMRCVLATQRMLATQARYHGEAEITELVTTRDVLTYATSAGARATGLSDQTGTITPGKYADLVLVTAEDVNNLPLNDPIGTIVLGTDARNVAAVFVGGKVRKWDGRLVGQDLVALRGMAQASRDHIIQGAGFQRPGSGSQS